MKAYFCFALLFAVSPLTGCNPGSSFASSYDECFVGYYDDEDTDTTLEDLDDTCDITSIEIDPTAQGKRNRKKKILYRRRAHAIKKQEKDGVYGKHTPIVHRFKRAKNLNKVLPH